MNFKAFLFKNLIFFEEYVTRFSVAWLKFVRGREKSEKVFMQKGLLPIIDHYYEPLINPRKYLKKSLRLDRNLPGIEYNDRVQLDILDKFSFSNELMGIPLNNPTPANYMFSKYFYNNGVFIAGDSEYYYSIIRLFKPEKIIEIGSGFSTLMAKNAILENKKDDDKYFCDLCCIEPYENEWLGKLDVNLIRKNVEDLDISLFKTLKANDILFIDSTHIIRPQGDVLFECLEILPILNSGVLVHFHDILTPKDYLDEWVFKHIMWNEQYLLEAFLTYNTDYEIIGALNYLANKYREGLENKCPIFAKQKIPELGSFWIRKK
jgi:hypothetical protein